MASYGSGPDEVYLDDQRWASIHDERARDPHVDRFWELTREYAESRGGVELEYWKQCYGHLWGIRYIRKSRAAARGAGVDVDQVCEFGLRMGAFVNARLDAEFGSDRVSRSAEPEPIEISRIPEQPEWLTSLTNRPDDG